MNDTPLSEPDRQLLTRLQGNLDELRRRLGIADRDAVLYESDVSYADDEMIVVVADGLGGAILKRVEGNFPLEYLVLEERIFCTEAEAIDAAESFVTKGTETFRESSR